MAKDKNTSRRQSLIKVAMLIGITEIVRQATSCSEIFNVGCHPLTHGKITTSPADRGTPELASGSFKEIHSLNGKHLEWDPFYGYMANVSCRPAVILSQRLMDFSLIASSRIWEKRALVR
jgi:hypothetical protein